MGSALLSSHAHRRHDRRHRGPGRAGAAPDGGVRARRLRARRAGGHPAGRAVPRRGRRGPARAHLRVHRSRRRGAVPAPRPHRADLPAAPGAPRRAATCRRATATAARPSAISRAAPTARTRASSARPASSSFAAPDREQDDAAVLGLIVEALREAGLGDLQLRIGDLGLFTALIDALAMPERWRRRLRHQFWRPEAFRAELARLDLGRRAAAPGAAARADRRGSTRPMPAGAEALVAEHLDAGRHRADRHAHGGRDRRAPAGRGRRRARDAAAAPRRPR